MSFIHPLKSLLILFPISSALKLPGPCPEMPPSNFSNSLPIKTLFAFIPFATDDHSQQGLFGPYRVSDARCLDIRYHKDDFTKGYFILTGTGDRPESRKPGVKVSIISVENGTVQATTSIQYGFYEDNPLICRKPVNESFRYWSHDSFNILWACRTTIDAESHDEAVILTIPGTLKNAGMERSKWFVGKYLSESLMKEINWEIELKVVDFKKCQNEDSISCPKKVQTYYLIVFFVGIAVLIVVIHLKDSFGKHNQVHVIS